jgi:hypothetical protein
MTAPVPVRWSLVAQALNRPYPVTPSMVVLVLLVPWAVYQSGAA